MSLGENALKDQINKHSMTEKDQYSSEFLIKIAYRIVVNKKAK